VPVNPPATVLMVHFTHWNERSCSPTFCPILILLTQKQNHKQKDAHVRTAIGPCIAKPKQCIENDLPTEWQSHSMSWFETTCVNKCNIKVDFIQPGETTRTVAPFGNFWKRARYKLNGNERRWVILGHTDMCIHVSTDAMASGFLKTPNCFQTMLSQFCLRHCLSWCCETLCSHQLSRIDWNYGFIYVHGKIVFVHATKQNFMISSAVLKFGLASEFSWATSIIICFFSTYNC
jgi:hypothetical protein